MAFYHCSIKTPRSQSGKFIPGKKHADYINREGEYKNYDNKEIAASHAEYINRQDNFGKDDFIKKHGQCVYKANKLPKWAKGSASKFFQSADLYGRVNGVSYREFELALQEELTLEQNIEIVNTILNKYEYFKDKYYTVAIHDKQAALDSGKQQIHCHIMASDKIIDDIELKNERPAERFFKRYSPDQVEKGGAQVDRHFSKDSWGKNVTAFRKFYCDVTNAVFRKYNIDKSIDYRSLRMQREEALRQGDYVKAEILNREPEKYLGPIVSGDKNNPMVQNLLEMRQLRSQRVNLILAADTQQKIMKDAQFISKIDNSVDAAKQLFQKTSSSNISNVVALKNNILFLTGKISDLRKDVLTHAAAKKLAKYKLLSNDEKTLFNRLYKLQNEERHLQKELKNSTSANPILNSKLQTVQKYISALNVQLRPVNKRFTESSWKSKITKNANYLMKENAPFRDKLEILQQNLDEQTAKLRKITLENINQSTRYSAEDVKYIIDNLIINVKDSISVKEREYKSLLSKVISPERAREIAYDVFTNHKFKELRQAKRITFKERIALEKQAEPIISKKDYAERIGDKELLNQCKNELKDFIIKYNNVAAREKDIQMKFTQLEKICNGAEQQQKIQTIIDGILSKNSTVKMQFNTIKTNLDSLKAELKNLKSLSIGVNRQAKLDKSYNIKYFVKDTRINLPVDKTDINNSTTFSSTGGYTRPSSNQEIKILAQAFNGIEEVAPLVARIDEDTNNTLDYVHLSTADKRAKKASAILKEFS